MNLRLRITWILALTVLVVVIGLSAGIYANNLAEVNLAFENNLREEAQQYARVALQSQPVQLREPAQSLLHERLGEHVVLLLRNKKIVDAMSEYKHLMDDKILRQLLNHVAKTNDGLIELPFQRAAVVVPIYSALENFNEAYKLILVAQDLAGMRSLEQLRKMILAWLGIGTLLAILVGNRLAGWLTKPMEQIAQTARAVEAGDFAARIANPEGNHEVASLKQHLNAMLERLQHLVGAQSRFTADAAHDLRTPLAVLKTEMEVSLRKPRDAESYKETLTRSLQHVRALSGLAEDLLTLTRLEAGAERRDWFLLFDALEPIVVSRTSEAARLGLQLNIVVPQAQQCFADMALLVRAVGNLLDNALRSARTKVELKTFVHENTLSLMVRDDGPGIPSEMRARVFDRFAHDKQSRGTGLGLAIVAEVARVHAGKISFVCENENAGTVFVLELPIPTSV